MDRAGRNRIVFASFTAALVIVAAFTFATVTCVSACAHSTAHSAGETKTGGVTAGIDLPGQNIPGIAAPGVA